MSPCCPHPLRIGPKDQCAPVGTLGSTSGRLLTAPLSLAGLWAPQHMAAAVEEQLQKRPGGPGRLQQQCTPPSGAAPA